MTFDLFRISSELCSAEMQKQSNVICSCAACLLQREMIRKRGLLNYPSGTTRSLLTCLKKTASRQACVTISGRAVVQGAWPVLQHWGTNASTEGNDQTAVVAALSFWDYSLIAEVQGSDTYKATGRCFSVAAGRISYTYGLKGALSDLFCFRGF